MELVELPHLSIGSPSEIAPPCVSQVEVSDLLEAARRVKAGSQLVGECLVVDKVVCACRKDGLFVKVHGIGRAATNPGNLRTNQRSAVSKILRAVFRPDLELPVMCSDIVQVLWPLAGRGELAPGDPGQRAVKVIFGFLKVRGTDPEQRLRLRRGVHGRSIVTSDIAPL